MPKATRFIFAGSIWAIGWYPAGANPQWIYIGTATTVVRFAYKSGDLKVTQVPEIATAPQ
jgi:hypothetical protein